MKERELDVRVTARYYVLGEINAATRAVWVVLHGYGQLARFFGRKFESLVDAHTAVIIPEGLSKFYLGDVMHDPNARVGAAWMTRENRLAEITNYVNLLDSIYLDAVGNHTPTVHVLGFSQGAATASRWVAMGTAPCHELVLWAGVFPEDLPVLSSDKLSGLKVKLVYGKADAWITPAQLERMQHLFPAAAVISFEGGHEVDVSALAAVTQRH